MESQKPLGEKFGYLDIASIDNKNNKISEVKFIATSDAPSRASRKVKFGDPNKERGLDYGPLIEKRALDTVAEKVAYAVKQGATLSYGGTRDEKQVGYFFGPTVLTDVTNEMNIMKEETFGPVIPIATFKTLEEVLEYANDSEYG